MVTYLTTTRLMPLLLGAASDDFYLTTTRSIPLVLGTASDDFYCGLLVMTFIVDC